MKYHTSVSAALCALSLAGCSMSNAAPSNQPTPVSSSRLSATSSLPSQTSSSPKANTLKSTPPLILKTVAASKRWQTGRMQYGFQVYWHSDSPFSPDDKTNKILNYVVGMGANSVGFTFPVYTDGYRPTKVYAGSETPTPTELTQLIKLAKARNLRVMVRPIIDEANIMTVPGEWRGSLEPRNTATWFASYRALLGPYLKAAQSAKADEFVMATELFSLEAQSAEWKKGIRAAKTSFQGTLSYGVNWDTVGLTPLPFVHRGLDLYPAVELGDGASVGQLTDALARTIQRAPKSVRANMGIHEVGIPAVSGMYLHPWLWGSGNHKLNLSVQTKWFAAACNAAKRTNVQGIYYWMIDSNVDPMTVDPASLPASSFIGRPAEQSIRACYR